jgi:outer membrane protein assembly factor BamE (lipoprotein component of BamABCDE complex)
MADAIHKVDQVEEGTTTREEVLKLLGEPDWKGESVFRGGEYVFGYSGSTSAGALLFGWGHGRVLYRENWWIDVTFDENGVVREVFSSERKKGIEATPP